MDLMPRLYYVLKVGQRAANISVNTDEPGTPPDSPRTPPNPRRPATTRIQEMIKVAADHMIGLDLLKNQNIYLVLGEQTQQDMEHLKACLQEIINIEANETPMDEQAAERLHENNNKDNTHFKNWCQSGLENSKSDQLLIIWAWFLQMLNYDPNYIFTRAMRRAIPLSAN
jgi:hypothetical protein